MAYKPLSQFDTLMLALSFAEANQHDHARQLLAQPPILEASDIPASPGWMSRLRRSPRFWKAVGLGVVSLALYVALFANAQAVLEFSVRERWSFVVPIAIAFLFSFVHGAFTGAFWDAVGLKPRVVRKS